MADRSLRLLISGDSAGAEKALLGTAAAADAAADDVESRFDKTSSHVGNVFTNLGQKLESYGVPGGSVLTKMGTKMDEASSHGSKLLSTMSAVGGLTLAAAGAGVIAFGAASVESATKFQAAMEMIHTQAGASQAEVNKMSSAVLSMAGSVGTAPDDLAEGLYHVESAGIHGAKALDVLRIAAEGAKVGHVSLEDTAALLGPVVNSNMKGAKNFQQAMGALNATVGAGDMRMQDLMNALVKVMPNAKTAGLSINDLGAALATMGDLGMRGSMAGTYLRQAISSMVAPSAAATTALGKIGLSQLQLATDMRQPNGFLKAMEDLKSHLDSTAMTAEQKAQVLSTALGGVRSSTGIEMLLNNMDRLKSKYGDVAAGANKFGADYKATTQTLQFQMDQAKASVEALADRFGMFLIPQLEHAIHAVADIVGWFEKHKTVAIALGAVIAGPLVASVGVFAATMTGKVVGAITRTGSSLLHLGSTFQAAAGMAAEDDEANVALTETLGELGAVITSLNEKLELERLGMGEAAETAASLSQAQLTIAESEQAVIVATNQAQEAVLAANAAYLEGQSVLAEYGIALDGLATDAEATAASVEASAASMATSEEGAAAAATAAGEAGSLAFSSMLGPIGLAAGALVPLALGFLHLGQSGPSAAQQTASAVGALDKQLSQLPTQTVPQLLVYLDQLAGKAAAVRSSLANAAPGSTTAQIDTGKLADLNAKTIQANEHMAALTGNTKALAAAFGITNQTVQSTASSLGSGFNIEGKLDPAQIKAFRQALEESGTAYDASATKGKSWASSVASSAASAVQATKVGNATIVSTFKEAMQLAVAIHGTGGAKAIAAFVNAQKGGLPQVEGVAKAYGVTIPTGYLEELEHAMKHHGGLSMTALATSITDNAGPYEYALSILRSEGVQRLAQQVADFRNTGDTSGQALAQGLLGRNEAVGSAGESVMIEALEMMEKHQGDSKAIGAALGQGIESGLLSTSPAIQAAAAQTIQNALNAAKTASESHSPSELFAREVGEPIDMGIAAGVLRRGATAAAVAQLLGHAASGSSRFAASLAAAGGTSNPGAIGGGGGTVYLTATVNINGNGRNDVELAQVVRSELLQMARGTGNIFGGYA